MAAPARTSIRDRASDESGAIVVMFAILLVILFGAVAFTIDLSRLFHERQVLQNAVDFGSLAGASHMPVTDPTQASDAEADALQVTLDNAPWLAPSQVSTSFRCVIGDRDGDGSPDMADVPYVCGPSVGTWSAGDFRTQKGRSVHSCDPYAGDKCNTIAVTTENTVQYIFAPVIGVRQGDTGAVNAVSCRGACGAAPAPLDVVMVLDRTRSMSVSEWANAQNAALSVLDFYDSPVHHVGLVALPYHNPGNPCQVNTTQTYPNVGNAWRMVGLSNDYDRPDGTLNPASQLVSTINCMQRAPSGMNVTPSGSGHTDIGDPTLTAANMLLSEGDPSVPNVIILLSDGEANQPRGMQPCRYANDRATTAKNAEVEIFTIAYGVSGLRCGQDTSGTYANAWATDFLSDMATDSIDDAPGGCAPSENDDGDHYFCESLSSSLEPVFRAVAAASVGNARLIEDF